MPTLYNTLQHALNHSYIIVNWYEQLRGGGQGGGNPGE